RSMRQPPAPGPRAPWSPRWPTAPAVTPTSDREDAAGDVALAPVHLQLVVPAVEVVDAAHLAGCDFPGIRIPQVPASAVVADDQLAAPGRAAILADRGTDAVVARAVAIHHHQPVIAHQHQAARRTEVVHARKETPGAAAVVALVDLGPHVAGGIALA